MAVATRTSLRTAWKESPAIIRAMGDGKHFLLLSRTGSEQRDREARLMISHLEFFLFPGREELPRGSVRPEFESFLEGAPDDDGTKVTLRYKAIVTDGLMVMEGAQLRGLEPFHVWTEKHLAEETRWDPRDPAFLMICKVHRLEPPIEIPWRAEYGAPGRWVRILEDELPATSFEPVLEHKDYLKVVVDAKKVLAEAQKNPLKQPEPPKAETAPPPKPAAGPAPAPSGAGKPGAPPAS